MEQRKTILASLSVALLVAGIALIGTAAAAIVDAPPKRDLTVIYVILGVAIAILALGAWGFSAILSDRLWLPGMKKVRQAARDHALAQLLLSKVVNTGIAYLAQEGIPNKETAAQLNLYLTSTSDLVETLWGPREGAVLRAAVRETPRTITDLHRWRKEMLAPFMSALEAFAARCHEVPLQTHSQRIEVEKWEKVFAGFTPVPEKTTEQNV